MKKLKIVAGFVGASLLILNIESAHAGRGGCSCHNMSNGTGTNTSNGTGTNASNGTGTNASNNTGHNTSHKSGYSYKVRAEAKQISEALRQAETSGNQAQKQEAISKATRFLDSIKKPQPKQLQQQYARSRQAW